MDCLYINLDKQEKRRTSIEANFAQHKAQGWELERISAFDADYVAAHGISGKAMPTEKACYLSQLAAIRASMKQDEPVLILEDDAMFGPHSCPLIDNVLKTVPSDEWDVLFCDIGPGSAQYMFELLSLRKHLARNQECKILSLEGIYFGCATSYIINPKSREKVLALLEKDTIDIPYDLALRNPIYSGELKGFVIFPFATTISENALYSQIQAKETAYIDFILSFFRMATWVDRDLEECKQNLKLRQPTEEDVEADIYGKIIGTLLSSHFAGR